jgi:hypothetical protein
MRWYEGGGKVSFVLSGLFLIISIGFNEVAAVLMPSFYLFAAIILYRSTDKRLFRAILLLFIIAFLSSAALALAPGNAVRSSKFHVHYQLLHSALYAVLQTGRFTATWLCTLPAVGFTLFVLSKANRLDDSAVLKFDYRKIAALLVFTVFMGSFLPYLTTGILGQHRTINYVFSFFILLWPWLLISVSKEYRLYQLPLLRAVDRHSAIVLITSILIMTGSANSRSILQDIYHDKFSAYKNEFLIRQDNIIRHPEVRIPTLKNIPQTFRISDAMSDSTCWIDQCMRYSQIELK